MIVGIILFLLVVEVITFFTFVEKVPMEYFKEYGECFKKDDEESKKKIVYGCYFAIGHLLSCIFCFILLFCDGYRFIGLSMILLMMIKGKIQKRYLERRRNVYIIWHYFDFLISVVIYVYFLVKGPVW